MPSRLFDRKIIGKSAEVVDFLGNILESSTEYSIIGKDLNGIVLLWNEGARRLYGYEPEDIIGKSSEILHTPEDKKSGLPQQMLQAALSHGKWEGSITRVRQNGTKFPARVVVTLRRGIDGREVLATLKTDHDLKQIPVVVFTTSQEEKDIDRCYLLGANCFITKPVGLAEYSRVVKGIEEFWLTIVRLPGRKYRHYS